MLTLPLLDSLAFAWFIVNLLAYSWLVDWGPWRIYTLTTAMAAARRAWLNETAKREMRMVDMQIVLGLQNRTAFFASSSLLALGASFSLLTAAPEVQQAAMDIGLKLEANAWGLKVMLLMACFGYAVFKFTWAYRMFNYASILIGGIPDFEEVKRGKGKAEIERAVRMQILSAGQFAKGMRGIFYAVAVLFWFAGPAWFFLSTVIVTGILGYRQFLSPPHNVMTLDAS